MKITFNVEITEKELAAALLPNGGKITGVSVSAAATRERRTSKATTQKGTAEKKAVTRTRKKKVQEG